MMKTNLKMWALAALAVLAFNACDDDDDVLYAPEVLTQALTAKYPTAYDVEWEVKGSYYVAECVVNDPDSRIVRAMDVWFSADGTWLLSDTDYDRNTGVLPEAVIQAFRAGEYAGWVVDEVDMLEYPTAPSLLYVIEVEQGFYDYQLFYREDGTLADAETLGFSNPRDVSGDRDDMHWPR